jgi:hypothetical protein
MDVEFALQEERMDVVLVVVVVHMVFVFVLVVHMVFAFVVVRMVVE